MVGISQILAIIISLLAYAITAGLSIVIILITFYISHKIYLNIYDRIKQAAQRLNPIDVQLNQQNCKYYRRTGYTVLRYYTVNIV